MRAAQHNRKVFVPSKQTLRQTCRYTPKKTAQIAGLGRAVGSAYLRRRCVRLAVQTLEPLVS